LKLILPCLFYDGIFVWATEDCGLPVPETRFWVKRELLASSHSAIILMEFKQPLLNAHLCCPFELVATKIEMELAE
jgi:hypothetical protein